jgi:hypothetical protein
VPSLDVTVSGEDIHAQAGGGVDGLRSGIRDLVVALERLKRAKGDPADSAITVQDLVDLGYATLDGNTLTRIEGWGDITADLGSGKVAGANQPTWSTFRDGIQAYEFSATQMKELWITFHVDHDYKDGSSVYPHVHWSPNTTSTGTVRWGFEYTVAKGHDQAAFPASVTVYVETTISSNKQYQHIISEVVDNDAFDAFEPDTLILMRIFRDAAHANDTFPDTVHAFTADIHFLGDGQFTPNKTAPFG